MPATAFPRRSLSDRQAQTVERLLDATLAELEALDFDELTIRSVATRAEVTHTTAYAYFSSKHHLVCEAFWRLLRSVPHPDPEDLTQLDPSERVIAALGPPARALSGREGLAKAALASMVLDDPDVSVTRDAVGADLAERLRVVVADGPGRRLPETLLLAFSGAMLQAGMGYTDFDGVVERMQVVAEQLHLDDRAS